MKKLLFALSLSGLFLAYSCKKADSPQPSTNLTKKVPGYASDEGSDSTEYDSGGEGPPIWPPQ